MLYWMLKYALLGPWLRLLFRPRVEGLEHLPAEGAAIIASNHLSFSDSIFMPLAVPRRVTFLAKQEYFTGRGLKGWLTRMFFTGVGQVPIDRASGTAAKAALETGKRILGEGKLLGHLPGGHPVAGRPALPRQDRGGPDGAGGRRPGDPGGHDRHPRRCSRSARSCRGSAGSGSASARRWTSPATTGWPATGSWSGR